MRLRGIIAVSSRVGTPRLPDAGALVSVVFISTRKRPGPTMFLAGGRQTFVLGELLAPSLNMAAAAGARIKGAICSLLKL